MGTLRFFEEVVSFKIRRTFGFADYTEPSPDPAGEGFFVVWKQECIFCRWPVWGVFKNGGMCGWKFAPG